MRWSLDIARRDQAPWVTWTSATGLVAAAVLAATGGLPVDLPMPTHLVGIVTPTCGLTRGSTAIVRGEFALAWRYNPASFVVIGFGLVGSARTVIGILTGRWMFVSQRMSRSQSIALAVGVATIITMFWVFQQTKAEFIIGARY